jgi:hypothetical protein
MQKFVPRCCVGIFRNECTRSTPLDPNLIFWCVSYCLGVFEIISLLYESLCKTGKSSCHEVVLEFFATNTPDLPHWTLNSCFGVFRSVWVYLGSFHCFMKHCPKRAELVQLIKKFVPQSRVRIFRNERTRSTPLDPKLIFGAFCSAWVHLGSFHYCMKLSAK